MVSYESQSLLKGHTFAIRSPDSCPLVNASEGKKKGFRALSFVRTDWPDHSCRNENLTFNQNYPVRSIKF